ncbi:unnamed protein product [Prunus armeniaca]
MVETRAQAKLKNKTVEMTSEAPESTSPITITETEHAVKISASVPITTNRAAEFSSELRTLFQERMPVTSSSTPPKAGQRSQERERFEPYGESSSLDASGSTQANSVRPTPCFGRIIGAKQPHAFRGPTTRPSSHRGRTGPSWPKQRDRCYVTVYDPAILTATHTHPGQTYDAYLVPPGSVATTEPPIQVAQQIRPQNEGQQVPRPVAAQQEAPPQGLRFEDVRRRIEDGLAHRRPEAPKYTKPYPPEFDRTPLPRNYRLLEFILFSGDGQTSYIEHIGRFTAQCGEADSDSQRLRLFVHSLTGTAFSWFINLPPNSVRDWSDMERIFHEHFYQTNREIMVTELARMSQASDESPRNYLQRFKLCRNWCRTNLPEREFVKMAEE